MGENSGDLSLGYMMGQSEGNSNGSFGGMFGEGLWAIIILAMLGFGNGGWGGGFGGGGYMNGALTRAELYDGFAIQNIDSAVRGVQQGICDSTYALNNTITNGFHGVDRGLCDLSHQLSDCCCENRAAIAQVRYDMATQACETRHAIQDSTREILGFLTTDKINSLTAENQALRFAASQANQNAFITANQEAQTAELIRRLGRDCPVPAYVVPNPNCCYGNPVGIGYGGQGYNGGCGC